MLPAACSSPGATAGALPSHDGPAWSQRDMKTWIGLLRETIEGAGDETAACVNALANKSISVGFETGAISDKVRQAEAVTSKQADEVGVFRISIDPLGSQFSQGAGLGSRWFGWALSGRLG